MEGVLVLQHIQKCVI